MNPNYQLPVGIDPDFTHLQEHLYYGLLSEQLLSPINVVQYRKLRLGSEIDLSTIYLTPRNGTAGCGILVEMPALEVLQTNVSGPPGSLVVSCAVLEEPNLNFAPETGTRLSAEWVSRIVLDSSHLWSDAGIGVMAADRQAIHDADEFPGLAAYRVRWRLQETRTAIPRTAAPTITLTGTTGPPPATLVTLACATPGAHIYYALGWEFPGPANPLATLYAAPFPAPPPGTWLRAAAYAPNMFRSSVIAQKF